MTLLSKIPGNNAGQIALWIARKDKDLADRFILFVRSSINEQELNRLNQEILKLSDADI